MLQKPEFFDVHAHVCFTAFEEDADEVIQRTLQGNTWMINVGTQLPTSKRAMDFAKKYGRGVYAAVGLHPTHVEKHPFEKAEYLALAQEQSVVAIGEVGLDYFRMEKDTKPLQEKILRDFLDIAAETNKPLIIHCRDAYEDLYNILKEYKNKVRGLIHCFVGNYEISKKFLELGFTISFTGIITFSKDEGLLRAAREVPLEKFTVETDCPYLTPVPHRGKRNEPLYVRHVAEKIAELKNVSLQDIAQNATQNSLHLFLPKLSWTP